MRILLFALLPLFAFTVGCSSLQVYVANPLGEQRPDTSVNVGWCLWSFGSSEPHPTITTLNSFKAVHIKRNFGQWLVALATLGTYTPMTADCAVNKCSITLTDSPVEHGRCGIDVATVRSGTEDTTLCTSLPPLLSNDIPFPSNDPDNAFREMEVYQNFGQKLVGFLTLQLYNPVQVAIWRERCSTEISR